MRWFKKWFFTVFWLLKILIFRLSPTRRLLLLIAFILPFITVNVNNNDSRALIILAGFILLFILMLELKDKLLAHHELSEGRLIQRALMPTKNPKVPGWEVWLFTRSANDVGGDLVDSIQIDKKRVGLTLADVSGKGLGAALLMAKLQATIKAIIPDYQSLDQLAAKINKIFYRDTLRSSFASLVFMELESNSENIRFINAGHFPPIKLTGKKITELSKGGSAIGLSRKSAYKEQKITLKKEDFLLIYSDGLTEARNMHGEFFGEKRMFDLLSQTDSSSAEELGEKLLKGVDRFIGDARRNDDLSLIVLRFLG
jgi:sigma-B regulation protein RsbU (phosphoserine phosphatase)